MISIFAKEAFLNVNPNEPLRLRTKPMRGHVMRVSSLIRGDQVADQIGAKYNPTEGFEDDVCIYVKPRVEKGDDFEFKGRVNYLDIIDGHNLGQVLLNHPDVKCIVCSQADKETMSKVIPNEIVLIPQHHCNFKRERIKLDEIRRIGIIGEIPAFNFLPKELDAELAKRGIELVKFSKFFSRQDIIDFYLSIDLQIVWRPYKKLLSNPLKIVNAASFGVPTIALDEVAFHEIKDEEEELCYVPVDNLDQFLIALDEFRQFPKIYEDYSNRCFDLAEEYHIENIGKLYKELDK